MLNAVRNVKLCGVLKQRDGSPYISLVIVSNDVAPTKKLMDNYLERHARLKELIITEDPTLKAILTNVQFIASTRGEYNRDIEMHDHQYDNCNHYKQYYSFFGTPYREASKTSSSTTKSKKSTKKTKANKKAAFKEVFSEEDEEDECSCLIWRASCMDTRIMTNRLNIILVITASQKASTSTYMMMTIHLMARNRKMMMTLMRKSLVILLMITLMIFGKR